MDKSWIPLRDMSSKAYTDGVDNFLKFAFNGKDVHVNSIYCPCNKCLNRYYRSLEIVKVHIEMYGFDRSYIIWDHHGENRATALNENIHTSTDSMVVDDTRTEVDEPANMVTGVNNLSDDSEDDSPCGKRGRGRAKKWEGWGNGKKIIEWDKDCNPIGENAAKLASHLGTYARNGTWFPLYWISWDGMDKDTLEMVWKDVQTNTNAPDGFKKLCFRKLNKAWKAFKYELKKKYYYPHETDAQHLAVVPPGVNAEQWPELVKYWSLESTSEISKKNLENRKNLCAHPRIGRNSIPNIVNKRKKVNQPVDRISIWRATRSKNGKYTEDDGAAELEQTLEKRLDELPEEERDDPEVRERIFLEVIGNDGHGQVLCGGSSTRINFTPSATSLHDDEADIARLRDEVARLREEAAERDRRDEERDRRDAERDRRYAEQSEVNLQLREEIAQMKSRLQVNLQYTADSEARVLRMLQSAGLAPVLASNASPRNSSPHGSNSKNQTT